MADKKPAALYLRMSTEHPPVVHQQLGSARTFTSSQIFGAISSPSWFDL